MTDLTWTEILEQVGKKRYTPKNRTTYFGQLKEQLDIKKQRKKNMELFFEIQTKRQKRIEESKTKVNGSSDTKPIKTTKIRKETDAFSDEYIKNVYAKVRRDKRTIKDSFWLRPDNNT